MRCGMIVVLLILAVVQSWAQTARPLYANLPTDVQPQLRNNRTFVPVRVISEQFGATVSWEEATQTVRLQRANNPTITLVIGRASAQVDGQTRPLDAAPFLFQGRTLVPLRFIAETYGIPVDYNGELNSVSLTRENTIFILPLESTKSGIRIYDPRRNDLVRNPIRVQGQANVFEGALIVEVQDSGGRVLGRTHTTAGMGGFYAYSVPLYYNLPSDDPANGRIVVYAEDPSGRGRRLAEASVTVRIASTI